MIIQILNMVEMLLSIAQAGLKKKWNIKRQHSSKIDTACFDFLPTIKILKYQYYQYFLKIY